MNDYCGGNVSFSISRLTHQITQALSDYAGWLALGAALFLSILGAALNLPSGYGIEDFLGFTDRATIAQVEALWSKEDLLPYAIAYLSLDVALFIPVYSLAILKICYWLESRFAGEDPGAFSDRHWLLATAMVATAMLVAFDFVETLIGLIKLGQWPWAVVCLAVAALLLVVGFRKEAHPLDKRRLVVLSLVAAAVPFLLSMGQWKIFACGQGHWLLQAGCFAHQAKIALIVVVFIACLLPVFVIWIAGLDARAADQDQVAQLRKAIGDVILRSRYILALLILLTALLVLGGQSRDILIGTVTDISREHTLPNWLSIGITLISLWTFSHSCWLWGRIACRVPSSPGPGSAWMAAANSPRTQAAASGTTRHAFTPSGPNPYIEAFAEYWARALGVFPLIIFAVISSATLHDLIAAGAPQGAVRMLLTSLAALGAGAAFIISREYVSRRQRRNRKNSATIDRYFDDASVMATGRIDLMDKSWSGPRYHFWFGIPHAPLWLPLVSLCAMVACRVPGSFGWSGWPPLAFATILFAFSAWMGFFGWLALIERRHSMPWVLLLVATVGLFGVLNLTDNHVVWSYEQHRGSDSTEFMWIATAAIAAVMGTAGWWLVARAQHQSVFLRAVVGVGIGGTVLLVLSMADHWTADGIARPKKPASGKETLLATADSPVSPLLPQRPDLQSAIMSWLQGLRRHQEKSGKPNDPLDVHIVAAEGGGIRAAYWTALALDAMEKSPPQGNLTFSQRTFSISGVSGGSVGAAVFVACRAANENPHECVRRFGQTDLVSPLLGSLMFEDVIARLVPTSWCRYPACGILSRGLWFERVLQGSVPEMKHGLLALRNARHGVIEAQGKQVEAAHHLPYLFLNSTWVESGERAIASDIEISSAYFSNSVDQISVMEHDLTLATASHNSARFPVINAMGSVHAKPRECSALSASPHSENINSRVLCGHLADGGYFDNTATQTTIDIVRGLRNFLMADSDRSDDGLSPERHKERNEVRAWARNSIRPILILIHNGIPMGCPRIAEVRQPTAADVACTGARAPFEPRSPLKGGPMSVYADVLGIAAAAINVTGLGANGRRAEALAIAEITELHEFLKRYRAAERKHSEPDASRDASDSAYRCIDQTNDGTLYPLGWYLSMEARQGMENQVTHAISTSGCRWPTGTVPPKPLASAAPS